MKTKKTSKSAALLSLAIAPFLFSSAIGAQNGYVRVYNLAEAPLVSGNYVRFLEGMNDDRYVMNPAVSAEIFYLDRNSVQHSFAGVDLTIDKKFRLIGSYNGVIPDGTRNYLRIEQVRPFPSNTLINCVVNDRNGVRAYDVRKLLAESSNNVAIIDLPLVSGSSNGKRYFTNDWFFGVVESSIKGISCKSGTNVEVRAELKPGMVAGVESSLNLTNWQSSGIKYFPPSVTNFAVSGPVSFNVTSTNSAAFFRLACQPYGLTTSNLLSQTEKTFGLAAPTTTLEATVQKKVVNRRAGNYGGVLR
jgi:hypothetical protein